MAAAEPLYALSTEPSTNTVVIGSRASLARTRISVEGRMYASATHVEAKLRYRSPAVGATSSRPRPGSSSSLEQPAYGVAPGQTAVLYDDGAIVGSGLITSASAV